MCMCVCIYVCVNPEYSLEGMMPKLNETPVLFPPDAKSQPIRKDPDSEKD